MTVEFIGCVCPADVDPGGGTGGAFMGDAA